jgi:hypothetical protein
VLAQLRRRAAAEIEILRNRRVLHEADRFVIFVGYPRSAHSLVGALLDSHPDVVVSHELDVLRYVEAGATRRTILGLILARERWFARRGFEWTGYSYRVPGQWQGRIRRAVVLGDKRGGNTTRRLAVRPELLDLLEKAIELPVHVIHVVRNPYDNVARMALKSPIVDPAEALLSATQEYLGLSEVAHGVRAEWPEQRWLDLHDEDLCARPDETLRRVCSFLGVETTEDWVAAASSIVFDDPRATRLQLEWPATTAQELESGVSDLACLRRYERDVPAAPQGGG